MNSGIIEIIFVLILVVGVIIAVSCAFRYARECYRDGVMDLWKRIKCVNKERREKLFENPDTDPYKLMQEVDDFMNIAILETRGKDRKEYLEELEFNYEAMQSLINEKVADK